VKIIGVYSIKAGVGKTSSTVNLAYLAAAGGHRTLVWDLDPQGAASYYFRVKPKIKGGGRALLRGKRPLDDVIKGTDFELLDLLPSDFSYRNMDILLEGEKKKPTGQLRRLLRPLVGEYDYVLFDCPPSISLMSENIFRAADALLVPLIPSTLSARTLTQLLGSRTGADVLPVVHNSGDCWPARSLMRYPGSIRLVIGEPIPSRGKSAKALTAEVERWITAHYPGEPYAPSNAASAAYRALWGEVERAV